MPPVGHTRMKIAHRNLLIHAALVVLGIALSLPGLWWRTRELAWTERPGSEVALHRTAKIRSDGLVLNETASIEVAGTRFPDWNTAQTGHVSLQAVLLGDGNPLVVTQGYMDPGQTVAVCYSIWQPSGGKWARLTSAPPSTLTYLRLHRPETYAHVMRHDVPKFEKDATRWTRPESLHPFFNRIPRTEEFCK